MGLLVRLVVQTDELDQIRLQQLKEMELIRSLVSPEQLSTCVDQLTLDVRPFFQDWLHTLGMLNLAFNFVSGRGFCAFRIHAHQSEIRFNTE